ncbi:hypothetical protein DFH07DRAFT_941562 [Mycena maculata]|uniref:Uncharacterized protein n=1 Tax=Mycena maculata TaxID=230809 RepID=A0AAD7IWF9_9AGAR|nr:hypothetical protein DFH07DRAFT_941562 [Mycena maculata]
MPPAFSTGGRRILRSSPSLYSLASSLSSISLYTTTSSRTQWGPGALTGKAILALGKATLRGAERVVILRRMITIKAHLPCYDEGIGGTRAAFMDGIFDDLLELSRPELYPDSIRHQAMELILIQIASGFTVKLVRCLGKWLLDDLISLMKEIMSICVFCDKGFPGHRLADAYGSALPAGQHPLDPCISFISELALRNETTFEAAILSKFLDLLLLVSSWSPSRLIADEKDELLTACTLAFACLSDPQLQVYYFWRCTLDHYGPFDRQPSLEDVVQHINATSPDTWLILEAQFLQGEAENMLELATSSEFPLYAGRSATDTIYPRLKDFSVSIIVPAHIHDIYAAGVLSSHALWYFLRCVALGGDISGVMEAYLGRKSHRSQVSLLSRIAYFLIPFTRESYLKPMKDLCASVGSRQRLMTIWSNFLVNVAATDDRSKHALLDAIIIVILPLLTPELKGWAIYEDLFRRSHFFPSLNTRPGYSKATLRLVGIIREKRMSSFIGEPNSPRSRRMAEVLEPIFNAHAIDL